jgi:hypothetical protein
MHPSSFHLRTFSPVLLCIVLLVSMSVSSPSTIQAAGNITGKVFRDFNANGVDDPNEPGIAGISVTAYDAAGAIQGTATSGPNGTYTLSTPAPSTGPYRVEFSGWPSYLQPSAQGASNGSSVQFVPSGGSTANFALLNPKDYSQPNPLVAIARYTNGLGTADNTYNNTTPGILAFDYNSSGRPGGSGYISPTVSLLCQILVLFGGTLTNVRVNYCLPVHLCDATQVWQMVRVLCICSIIAVVLKTRPL